MPTEQEQPHEGRGRQLELSRSHRTNERMGFVEGLFGELESQLLRYIGCVRDHQRLQAQIEVVENALQTTRNYIRTQLADTEEEVPVDWELLLKRVRFVGYRLGDASVEVIKEAGTINTHALLDALNNGQFRFRTGHPLREINAALLRAPHVYREDDFWVYDETRRKARRLERIERINARRGDRVA